MDKTYSSVIEALIFSSDEPITASQIAAAIKGIDGADISIQPDDIENIVNLLNEKYSKCDSSIQIIRIAGGYIFTTKPEHSKYVGFLSTVKSKRRLSQQALETLSIIAYKQPITKPEIESIRGVSVDYMMNTLLEKNLITIKGRADTVGRPLLYITTSEFLKYFGLDKISDLPKPREIEEIMRDEEFIEQRRRIMMNEIEEIVENESELNDNDTEAVE